MASVFFLSFFIFGVYNNVLINMNTFLLLAYITGGLIIAYSLILYIFPSRRLNLLLKAIGDFLGAVNLLFIYLYTNNPILIAGITTCMIGCVREILFSFREKWKVLNHIAWPIGFSLLFLGSLFFTYKGPLSLMPPIASVISTIFFYITNKKLFKIGAIIATSIYAIYYAILLSSSDILTIFSLLNTIMSLISSIIGLVVIFYHERKNKEKIDNESHVNGETES